MKSCVLAGSVLLCVLFLTVSYSPAAEPILEGTASPQSASGNEERSAIQPGAPAAIWKHYADQAQEARQRAELYRGLAASYAKIHGTESELVLHYRKFVDLMVKQAEEDEILSRLHHENSLKDRAIALRLEIQRDRQAIATGGNGGAAKLKKLLPGKEASLSAIEGELQALLDNTDTGP